jgi:hypothetical protein
VTTLLAGGNLNAMRRRYDLDTEFGGDTPLHPPPSADLLGGAIHVECS